MREPWGIGGRLRVLLWVGAAGAVLAGCVDANADANAVRRGDVAFAADSLEEAIAEYRLAVLNRGDDPSTLARAAHTYAELGRVDEAADFYSRAMTIDPAWADEAAADLMHLAREASRRQDRFRMATAVQKALEFRPGIGLGELALPLARHYFRNGEFGRALPLYTRALAAADSVPRILFEIAQAHEEIGDCQRALVYFEQYREVASRSQRDETNWHIGSCALRVARELRSQGQASSSELEEALSLVNRTIEVGEPRNVQGQAWFERGEIQAAMGECTAAMESFAQVRLVEATGGSALVKQAQDRYDRIRFGRGLDRFRESGACY